MEENGNKIEKVNGIGKGSKIGREEAREKVERGKKKEERRKKKAVCKLMHTA